MSQHGEQTAPSLNNLQWLTMTSRGQSMYNKMTVHLSGQKEAELTQSSDRIEYLCILHKDT